MTTTAENLPLNKFRVTDNILSFDGLMAVMTTIPLYWKTKVQVDVTRTEYDEGWFWTEEWLAGEKEADDNLTKGQFKDFETIDQLISYLHAQK